MAPKAKPDTSGYQKLKKDLAEGGVPGQLYVFHGEETYLRMRQYFDDGSVKVEGAWNGIDECGASDKGIIKLRKGDTITPTYFCIDDEGEDLDEYEGDPFTLKSKTLPVNYDFLYAGDYSYAFCITDIYGDDYISDLAEFRLGKDGTISFYE